MYIKHYICFYNCSVYRDNSVKARQKHFLAWQVIPVVSFLEFCIGVDVIVLSYKRLQLFNHVHHIFISLINPFVYVL